MESRPCRRCNGVGAVHHEAFASYPARDELCRRCGGSGKFDAPNVETIVGLILCKQGRNKGLLKSSMRSEFGGEPARAYYVWRMARFHGGADVTLPMMAQLSVTGDPFVAELDKMADIVAQKCFGSDMEAAKRWGPLLVGDLK